MTFLKVPSWHRLSDLTGSPCNKCCTNVCNAMKEMDVKNAEIRKKSSFRSQKHENVVKTSVTKSPAACYNWPLFVLTAFDVICHLKLKQTHGKMKYVY